MRIESLHVSALLSVLTLIAACSDTTNPNGSIDLSVMTDKAVYSLASDQAAEPILINRGSMRVYLPMNEYVAVQRFEGGAWSAPQPWFAVDGASISFPLEPADTLRAWPMSFGYVGNTPGVYRFIFEIAKDPNGRQILSESLRVSSPFELRQ